ncbi:hypothetical protein J6590_096505 [Homalodisca vitripennis]|nr:hypothetical protein J6590_096505 [Homalodisca vitripennis]
MHNTGYNKSAFVYQPPTTDQRPITNGNRHGRKEQVGGNKMEEEQKRRDLARAGSQLCTSVLPRGNFRRFAPQPTLRIDYHSNGTVKQ